MYFVFKSQLTEKDGKGSPQILSLACLPPQDAQESMRALTHSILPGLKCLDAYFLA